MDGELLSICDPWEDQLDAIANSVVFQATFELSRVPDVDTIAVFLNGDVTIQWTYDEELVAVVLADAAHGGDNVFIEYEVDLYAQ